MNRVRLSVVIIQIRQNSVIQTQLKLVVYVRDVKMQVIVTLNFQYNRFLPIRISTLDGNSLSTLFLKIFDFLIQIL